MSVHTFPPARKGECLLLEAALPGRAVAPAGVLLFDPEGGRLLLKWRARWEALAEPEDAEVLSALGADLAARSEEMGGAGLLAFLEDCLSHTLRLGERETVAVGDFERALERLYARRVEGERQSAEIVPFRTHLPRVELRATAGTFNDDVEVLESGDWVRAPEGLRLEREMFASQVTGASMEPVIPDGSLCVFRKIRAGTRQGRIVLARQRATSQTGGEFTVKYYSSRKRIGGDGWEHETITLRPANPAYSAIELRPEQCDIIAEFLRVLTEDEL